MSVLRTLKEGQGIAFDYKLKVGRYVSNVKIKATLKDGRLWYDYKYNKELTDELKICLSGMKWHGFENPPIKKWSSNYDEHNIFQLEFLAGLNPYEKFEKPPIDFEKVYPLKKHQYEGVAVALQTRRAIFGYEMGLGKTLMVFEIAQHLKPDRIFWVSTRSALLSVKIEEINWKFNIPIVYLTYDGLKNYVANWKDGSAPIFIVGDESHKLKNLTSQRTQTFNYVAKAMREEHGDKATIILMTGTPAPKSPIDWYSQCHIVAPGFLKEGSIHSFKERLAIVKVKENTKTGGVYPELLSWRDSDDKCDICGQIENSFEHDTSVNLDGHTFVRATNEVAKLYRRMQGLVHIRTKKDCTDLPEKYYQKIYCQPSTKTKQAMKMIAARHSGARALTLLRELSDGFQYTIEKVGFEQCPQCEGRKVYTYPEYIGPVKTVEFCKSLDPFYDDSIDPEDFIIDPVKYPQLFKLSSLQTCPACEGSGEVRKFGKTVQTRTTAKDKALIDLLDEHEEIGRLVVYAGFTATLDRLCELVRKQGWNYIKLDGKGFRASLEGKKQDLLLKFKRGYDNSGKIVFIGNPGAASTGLTLTASPTVVFYSNTFNCDDRVQAEDRIHRLGMDENKGARIIDLIHLPTDEYVLENLAKKKNLQDMSMGILNEYVNKEREKYDYTEV